MLSPFEQFVVDGATYAELTDLGYAIVGLGGEAGEVLEWYKKKVLRTTPCELTDNDLKLELGDVLHYIARVGYAKGWTLADIMSANIEKCNARRIKNEGGY